MKYFEGTEPKEIDKAKANIHDMGSKPRQRIILISEQALKDVGIDQKISVENNQVRNKP